MDSVTCCTTKACIVRGKSEQIGSSLNFKAPSVYSEVSRVSYPKLPNEGLGRRVER
jgi:hypothetical protein